MTFFRIYVHISISVLMITLMSYANAEESPLPCIEEAKCISCIPFGNGGFINVDLLYWKAVEGGLDTCVSSKAFDHVTSEGKVKSKFSGSSRDPHFKWNPGFRIGAGYELFCSCWYIASSWTHFHSQSGAIKKKGNDVRWNINFDAIDVLAGYAYDLSSCFTLIPFGGLRGVKIYQKLSIDKFSCSKSSSIENNFIKACNKKKENLFGIGPLIGLEAEWNINCGFSLFANASISWLYGSFAVKFIESESSIDTFNFCKARKHLNANLAVADAALGIRWQKCICSNTRLILQFGLEHHRYFDYNRFGGYGDLCFDGLNFSGSIEF